MRLKVNIGLQTHVLNTESDMFRIFVEVEGSKLEL